MTSSDERRRAEVFGDEKRTRMDDPDEMWKPVGAKPWKPVSPAQAAREEADGHANTMLQENEATLPSVGVWKGVEPFHASDHEPPEHIIQFFNYAHLPDHLQHVSKPFCELAQSIVRRLPRNPERTVALRKLLEAKDAAVRALLAK